MVSDEVNIKLLVSILMPVYNAEKFLKSAIESVLQQTYKDIELIIINDGSTDSSLEIIKTFNDSRIRIYEHAENKGIVFTRNECIEYANGEYIAFLDSDDIAHSSRIYKQLHFLEQNKDIGLCGSYYEIIDQNDVIQAYNKVPVNDSQIRTHLLLNNCFCNSSVLIRKYLLNTYKYVDEYEMAEDYFLWYKLSKVTKLSNIPEYLTQYRVHGNNISIRKTEKMLACRYQIDKVILKEFQLNISESQIKLHSNFILDNFSFFNEQSQINDLQNWFNTFYNHVKKNKEYDSETIVRIISLRWLSLLVRKRRFSKDYFFSKLSNNFGILYYKYLIEFIYSKFTKIHKVY